MKPAFAALPPNHGKASNAVRVRSTSFSEGITVDLRLKSTHGSGQGAKYAKPHEFVYAFTQISCQAKPCGTCLRAILAGWLRTDVNFGCFSREEFLLQDEKDLNCRKK